MAGFDSLLSHINTTGDKKNKIFIVTYLLCDLIYLFKSLIDNRNSARLVMEF